MTAAKTRATEATAKDRWAVIAGASGGIGRAVGRVLARDGWNLALLYRGNREGANAVRDDVIESFGVEAQTYVSELTDALGVAGVIEEIASSKAIHGLVYAAGPHIPMKYVGQQEPGMFSSMLDADAKGFFNLVQPALPHLREHHGRIVAMSTAAAGRYAKRDLLSTAPKAVVEAVVRAVAVEEGRFGVRANAVRVGLLEGEGMWSALVERGDFDEAWLDAARRNIPLHEFGDVSDVAEATGFLMSDASRWITGQTLAVDGGYST